MSIDLLDPYETIRSIVETPEYRYKVMDASHYVDVEMMRLARSNAAVGSELRRYIAIESLMKAADAEGVLVLERRVFGAL